MTELQSIVLLLSLLAILFVWDASHSIFSESDHDH